ncbi:hypothetical protein D9V86_09585 [Bacteroidetes/Chlorobi group bacterium ChocPot_Mid]|nr:MAG: hypothetical protein D9V86_09585 [Bacteroidetes/Chlorobi group bacterium ChocPot_Mid]
MNIIKIEHENFRPIRIAVGGEQLLETKNFKCEFELTELERKLFWLKKDDYNERLNLLGNYLKLLVNEFSYETLIQSENYLIQGVFLLFEKEDIHKSYFYLHFKFDDGINGHIGQFQLKDNFWRSAEGEISNSFQIGLEYSIHMLSKKTFQMRITPLCIQFFTENEEYLRKKNIISLWDLLIHLSYFCVA